MIVLPLVVPNQILYGRIFAKPTLIEFTVHGKYQLQTCLSRFNVHRACRMAASVESPVIGQSKSFGMSLEP